MYNYIATHRPIFTSSTVNYCNSVQTYIYIYCTYKHISKHSLCIFHHISQIDGWYFTICHPNCQVTLVAAALPTPAQLPRPSTTAEPFRRPGGTPPPDSEDEECWWPTPRCGWVDIILSNYSDLTRPHPKWWFSNGNPLISGKSRLVKYYNLARYYVRNQKHPWNPTKTPSQSNMSSKEGRTFNRKYIWTNHWFSGDMFVWSTVRLVFQGLIFHGVWVDTLRSTNIAGLKMHPDWRCMDPIENGDIPASYVSLSEGIYNIHHGKNMSIAFIYILHTISSNLEQWWAVTIWLNDIWFEMFSDVCFLNLFCSWSTSTDINTRCRVCL